MQRLARTFVFVATALLLSAMPAGAQITAEQANSQGDLNFGTLRLSLAEAVSLGLQYNLDVEVERHAPLVAFEDSQIAWGAYDPAFGGEAGYGYQRQINTFVFNAGLNKTQLQDGSAGVRGTIPYLNMDLGLEYVAGSQDSSNSFQLLSPEYNAGLRLNARIPLLRDLIYSQEWTEVKSSALRYSAANENFRTNVMDIVQDIEDSYWNLVASNDQVRVASKSLDTATALLEQTRTEYEVGVKSKVEVYESEAGMAEREFELIRAENVAENSQDLLINTVLGTKLTAGSLLQIEPTDSPDDVIEYQINPEEAAKVAFSRRPELAEARKAVEDRELQLKFAKNQRLPRFDVVGAIGTGGVDGVSRVDGSTLVDGSFGGAHQNFFKSQGEADMSVRALITIPLGNIRGRHTVSRSQLELRRTNTQLLRLEQSIILEIRSAARNLESAQRGIVASERRRIAAAEQLRAEEIRLEHGESTPFDVLLRERDLVEAESQKIAALELYRNSLTALHRSQGTILDVRSIHISDVEPLRQP